MRPFIGSPRSVHVNVQEGERVRAGDPLIDGPIDPHDVLSVLGIKELQKYLVDKIQEVYRSQLVAINVKHIEVQRIGRPKRAPEFFRRQLHRRLFASLRVT